MFWLLFAACGRVFVAYKAQDSASLLLPELDPSLVSSQYAPFYAVLGTTLAAKTLAVLIRIREQATMDVYLVDLEKPGRETKQVNAWRHYFVANEFAELQSGVRYVPPETTFIWFSFFWVGLGW